MIAYLGTLALCIGATYPCLWLMLRSDNPARGMRTPEILEDVPNATLDWRGLV